MEQQKLSRQQKRHAMRQPKSMYPEKMYCANCGEYWMRHCGTLCPAPGMQEKGIYMYIPGETTFLPDLASIDNNPQFDVLN